jgi:glycosyltransferase involved in cell wall biosynthesis
MVSVIIPYFNEASVLTDCIRSLSKQTYRSVEIIVIDDGSTDNSRAVIEKAAESIDVRILYLEQTHKGPAHARNLGASHAKGEILVFADADMNFDRGYIEYLIAPILEGKAKGTFTKEEFVANWDNIWSRCWNYNEGIATNRRVPDTYPDISPVFRAIRKNEFVRVGGFDPIGFTDDWTLSRKLGYSAVVADNAICYHNNPSTLIEIYKQARWIGKNEFISGTLNKRLISLIRYNEVIQLIRGGLISLKYKEPEFLIFQAVYYTGIYISIVRSFMGEGKNK